MMAAGRQLKVISEGSFFFLESARLKNRKKLGDMYLVQVDDGLPEVVLLLVEVTHTNLTEVTGMVLFEHLSVFIVRVHRLGAAGFASRGGLSNLVQVGAVVVLTTGHTTTTGMLAVLSYTTVSVGDVAATVREEVLAPMSLSSRCRTIFRHSVDSNRLPQNTTIPPY